MVTRESKQGQWPSIPYEPWSETLATLHLWTQVLGKIRLSLAPVANHWWDVTLYVTSSGLTTSPIPYGRRTFDLDLDLFEHRLLLATSDGARRSLPLEPYPVAEFYAGVMVLLREQGIEPRIDTRPNEVVEAIPFEQDRRHAAYDREAVRRFHLALLQADRLLKRFRARFIGKASPVHFFWGSFDLATSRFSGRRAPEHPGGIPNLPDWVTREAYSHEVSSCGFWPGSARYPAPVFYSYVYPEPRDFRAAVTHPKEAGFAEELGEYVLPYEQVRGSSDPDRVVLDFLQSTYDAAAELGRWDRAALERPPDELMRLERRERAGGSEHG